MTEAIFVKNHKHHVESAARVSAADPQRLITFQSKKRWKQAADLVKKRGAGTVPVFFALVDVGPVVEYQGWLQEVILNPSADNERVRQLLDLRTETTEIEDLWSGENGTVYAISGCHKLAAPIPYAQLLKASNGVPLSNGYGYSYSVVLDPGADSTPAPRPAVDLAAPAPSTKAVVTRYIRDTALTRRLKALYDHRCQLCQTRLTLLHGQGYSEGHHLQPLGGGHGGPDVQENVLILCPNCHALCDMSAIIIKKSTLTIDQSHSIGDEFIDYHNAIAYEKGAT